jgi:hypothetical protein
MARDSGSTQKGINAEMLVAILALVIAFLGTVGNVVVANTAYQSNKKTVVKACHDIETLKGITRQALEAAIQRARASQPDAAATASIIELRREIKLLAPRACTTAKEPSRTNETTTGSK